MENNQQSYEKAREKVKALKEFYGHVFSFTIVNIFLAAVNYYTNEWAYAWFLWVTFSWGIGLIFNALKVFELNPFYNRDWEERKIKEYMEKEKSQRWR